MNDDRDPLLERAFADARQDLANAEFTDAVLARVAGHRRRLLAGRLSIVAVVVLLELLLDSPLQASIGLFGDYLGSTIVPVENEWVDFALSPFNSIAGVLGIVLLAVHYVYRRFLH